MPRPTQEQIESDRRAAFILQNIHDYLNQEVGFQGPYWRDLIDQIIKQAFLRVQSYVAATLNGKEPNLPSLETYLKEALEALGAEAGKFDPIPSQLGRVEEDL